MRRHPEWGEKILSGIQFLEEAAEIVIAHHERWDGKGYPRGLAGEAIPLGARTFAVADAFDAITSERPYRSARPYGVARAELIAGSGTQFDPRVVQAFLEIPEEEWREMRAQVQDPQRAPEPLPGWAGLLNALPTPGEEGADPNGKPGSGREETNRSALTGKRGS